MGSSKEQSYRYVKALRPTIMPLSIAILLSTACSHSVGQKHPTLVKVEKIYDGKGSSIKVYLRDGRLVDLPGTAIPQLDQVPSATVLTLAGINAADARSNETKTKRAPKKLDK